jgi:hypothetical protein
MVIHLKSRYNIYKADSASVPRQSSQLDTSTSVTPYYDVHPRKIYFSPSSVPIAKGSIRQSSVDMSSQQTKQRKRETAPVSTRSYDPHDSDLHRTDTSVTHHPPTTNSTHASQDFIEPVHQPVETVHIKNTLDLTFIGYVRN